MEWLANIFRLLPPLQRWWANRQAGTPATSEEVREENKELVGRNRSDIDDLIDDKFGSPE